jgi:hypothetical protein
MIQMIQKGSGKSSKIYECKTCDYTTSRKSQYDRHVLTQKHKNGQNDTNDTIKVPFSSVDYVCNCGKKYTHKQNLYRHQKDCEKAILDLVDISGCIKMQDDVPDDLLQKLVLENTEIKSMLFHQFESIQEQQKLAQTENKELRNQISELIPKVGSNNNTINNTINSKQKVNINIFLNEQCKDALTMNEFINKIKVTLDDLMLTKTKGLSEGVSNIFIENMNKLSLYERPMHCTDAKRETMYIKCDGDTEAGDGWARDEENKNLKMAINKVTHVQRQNMDKWIKEHPNWQSNSDEQEDYMKLVRCCTDDFQEDKIIKRLCNSVYLNPDDAKGD